MWAAISASVRGTSHKANGTPCQDACEVLACKIGEHDVLLAAIADGAGSASHSHIGSREAVQVLLRLASREITNPSVVDAVLVRTWYQHVLEHLATFSEREGVEIGQLACTLLFAAVWRTGGIFAQVGDGAWVVDHEGKLGIGTWPETGEYANVTVFLTSRGALDLNADQRPKHLQVRRLEGTINSLAGFTDGLQMLALDFVRQIPFEPFFQILFTPLRETPDQTQLIAPLQQMLASDPIVSRTDDDTSLVLAVWREPISDGAANVSAQ
jgi:hypothetical protein